MTINSKFIGPQLLLLLAFATTATAETCGVLHYVASKSNGVTVTSNACGVADDVAVGAEFKLLPGARLWFKSKLSNDTSKMQGICQSRAQEPLSLVVNSNSQPWIQPGSGLNCSAWSGNKMQCADIKASTGALTCVLAADTSGANTGSLEERTTSVRMRSLPALNSNDLNEQGPSVGKTSRQRIIADLQAEAVMCRAANPGARDINVNWLVDAQGRVVQIDVPPLGVTVQNLYDKQMSDCISAVIKDFNYPKSSEAVWLTSQF